jgi:hypothetical protein
MICIGIPVCRPIYKKYLDKWTSRDGSKYKEPVEGGSYPLQTIGGSYISGTAPHKNNTSEDCKVAEYEKKVGIKGPFTKTRIYSKPTQRVRSDDESDESILGPDYRRNQQNDLGEQGIRVTYEVTTSRQSI